MQKQLSLEKNSFTLLETIFAITIISIVIGGFLKSSNYNDNSHINLQNIKNNLIINNSNDTTISKFGLKYIIELKTNVTITNLGNETKLVYNKNNIFFEKYNLAKNQTNLNSKVFK